MLVWQEKGDFVPPARGGGESVAMQPEAQTASSSGSRADTVPSGSVFDASTPQPPARKFGHTFARIQAPFAFRVFAGESYSRNIRVEVRPTPRILRE